jgi:hypothetical protein
MNKALDNTFNWSSTILKFYLKILIND